VAERFDDEIFPVVLARMLVEKSPTGWAYKHSKDQPSPSTRGQVLPFPQDLLVYKLYYDKKERLWLPRIHGRMAKVQDAEADEDGSKTRYSIDESYGSLRIGKSYWVKSLDNKERQSKYRDMIRAILQGKSPLALNHDLERGRDETYKNITDNDEPQTRRLNHVGFRYGKSMAKSESLVNEVDMVSAVAEIGVGLLAGLRGSYDIFPRQTRGSGIELEYFELRRASLGWALTYPMPKVIQPLLDKIDIQPKIGLLNLRSHYYAETLDGKTGLDFNAKNVYDLALETGVEKTLSWLRSRLWIATSSASLGVSSTSSVTVKSLRGGIDLYFDLFKAEGWDINILTFAKYGKAGTRKGTKLSHPRSS
jgi:hypothetical protein